MQNNPDVNSLNIGEESETHPETTITNDDSKKTNAEGLRKHVPQDQERNISVEQTPSSGQTEEETENTETR